eukprot:GHUV01005565.1.p1 GENE.GHUV01005565.1~~GHUV01005565.1.p1  ORF type:complete len:415 (+),score=129.13 GHUV01005565.1:253-1497(+)
MGYQQLGVTLVIWLASLCSSAAAQARVVQLVAENPSTFVSTNPNDPKYIVSLFDDELKASSVLPDLPLGRSTIMTDAKGQQYNCSIPSSASSWSTSVAQQQDTAPPPPVTKTPFELLESLDGLCFYRQDGLWTYEVCHRKHVRQFRQDANKNEDFICGKYIGDDQQTEAILEDASSSGHPLKYVSHTYSGGASCVLTGAARTAEVRYTCVRDAKENIVLSVREFPTCNYVVVVSTPFLCKHPAFTPPAEDLRLISCIAIGLEKQPTGAAAVAAALPDKASARASTTAAGDETMGQHKPGGSQQTAAHQASALQDGSRAGDNSGSSRSSTAEPPAVVLEGELLSAESIPDDQPDESPEDLSDDTEVHSDGDELDGYEHSAGEYGAYEGDEEQDEEEPVHSEQEHRTSAASDREEL